MRNLSMDGNMQHNQINSRPLSTMMVTQSDQSVTMSSSYRRIRTRDWWKQQRYQYQFTTASQRRMVIRSRRHNPPIHVFVVVVAVMILLPCCWIPSVWTFSFPTTQWQRSPSESSIRSIIFCDRPGWTVSRRRRCPGDYPLFAISSNEIDTPLEDELEEVVVIPPISCTPENAAESSTLTVSTSLMTSPSNLYHRRTVFHSVSLVSSAVLTSILGTVPQRAEAAGPGFLRNRVATSSTSSDGLYVMSTREDGTDYYSSPSPIGDTTTIPPCLSSAYALLKVLPVKNPIFRTLEQNIVSLSTLLRSTTTNSDSVGGGGSGSGSGSSPTNGGWRRAEQTIDTAISLLVNKRRQLEPVFNPEDSTELAILKAERGEILIGELFQDLEYLKAAISAQNITSTLHRQRNALLNLGYLGELLVKEFPYIVPSRGKYSFLPRLLGRARVTFSFKRAGNVLGDVTIMADGYTAPITAGNFVDLCTRNFYTGLPIKETTKKVGQYQEPVSLSINVLGSFNEGFYDPLTGKLRRIPLEIIRLEGKPKLTYTFSRRFLESSSLEEVPGEATVLSAPAMTSKPLLTFETPGLIAFNHPSNDPNGGSSEFFGLQQQPTNSSAAASSSTSKANVKRNLLDGLYAPFGYIIDGMDIFNSLQPDDVIHSTTVDEFGQLNLVKIRSSSFKEVAQGTEEAAK